MYIPDDILKSLEQTTSKSNYNQVLNFFLQAHSQRKPEDQNTVVNILDELFLQTNESFGSLNYSKDLLAKCIDKMEYNNYTQGSMLTERGQKCEEVIIVLKGAVNVYDLKPYNEIAQQKAKWQDLTETEDTTSRVLKPSKAMYTPDSIFEVRNNYETQSPLSPPKNPRIKGIIAHEYKIKITPDNSPAGSKTKRNTGRGPTGVYNFSDACSNNSQFYGNGRTKKYKSKLHSEKVSASLSLLTLKPPEQKNEPFEKHPNFKYRHLPKEEMLLLKDKVMKDKYIHDGACMLMWKDTLIPGSIINQKCLKYECRNEYTLVAAEDTETIQLNKRTFLSLFQDELELFADKKKYFTDFFEDIEQNFVNVFFNYLTEKAFIINDKIYNQDDDANGLYFIKSGEVKCCASLNQEQEDLNSKRGPELIKEKKVKIKAPLHENIPKLRKEVIGTQWLRGIRKTKRENSLAEKLFAPQSQSNQQNNKAIVGMLGQGNSFGEEGLVTNDRKRAYSAFAATSDLHVYFLSSQYYSTIQLLFPKLVRILVEKAQNKNSWLEKRVEDVKEVLDKISRPETASKLERKSRPQSPLLVQKRERQQQKLKDFTSIGRKNNMWVFSADIGLNKSMYTQNNVQKSEIELEKSRLGAEGNTARRKDSSIGLEKAKEYIRKHSFGEKPYNLVQRETLMSAGSIRRKMSHCELREQASGIEKEGKPLYIEAVYKEVKKNALNYIEKALLPEPEELNEHSMMDRLQGFGKYNSSAASDQSYSFFLPAKMINIDGQEKVTKIVTNRERKIGKKQHETSGSKPRNSTRSKSPIPKKKYITGRSYIVPAYGSMSARMERGNSKDNNSSEEFSAFVFRRMDSESPDLFDTGVWTERKASPVSQTNLSRKFDHIKNNNREGEEKKRPIVRSKHNMFRVKPQNSVLLACKYQFGSPGQTFR